MSQSDSFIITEESEKSSGVRGIRFTQRNRGNRERPERGFWEILSQVIVSFVRGTISSVERGDPSGGGGVGSWIFSFISAFLWIFSVTLCSVLLRTLPRLRFSCSKPIFHPQTSRLRTKLPFYGKSVAFLYLNGYGKRWSICFLEYRKW